MDIFSADLFALLCFALFCGVAVLYSSQAKVRGILSRFPEPPEIENTALNLIEKELAIKIKEYKRRSPEGQKRNRDALVKLKHKCRITAEQTGPEYKSYNLAAQDWIQAWRDLDIEFHSAPFFKRSLSAEKSEAIKIYLKRYFAAKYRFELAHKKLSSRDRVWLSEGKAKPPQEKIKAPQAQKPQTQSQTKNAPEAGERALAEPATSKTEDSLPLFLEEYQNPELQIEGLFADLPKEQRANLQVDQVDLLQQAPDFSNLTYLDRELNFSAASKIAGGDFSYSFFISVEITGLQEIQNSLFFQTDFSNAGITGLEEAETTFTDCWFQGASFKEGSLAELTFINCSFKEVDFSKAHLENIRFIHCQFSDCKGIATEWINCSLSSLSLNPESTPSNPLDTTQDREEKAESSEEINPIGHPDP